MRVTKKFLLTAAITSCALVLGACAPSTSGNGNAENEGGAATTKVTVGVITSSSGPLASYGEQYLDGFNAGLDYATNGTNKVGETEIIIEEKDDAGDADKAVTAAKEMIGQGVNILAGSASSAVALAVSEQAAQNKVLFISGPAAVDALTGINKYTFRSGRQSSQDVATAGTFLEDVKGKKITVLAQNSAFGKGNEEAVKALLGAKGATVTSVLVPENATEFTPFAQQVLSEDPDLVFVAWAGATTGSMWQSMSQQGVLDKVTVVTGLGDSSSFNAYGAASEKINFLNHYFPGAPDNDVNTAMVKAVEDAGGSPDLFTPDGFTAALMITHAIEEGNGNVDDMIASLEGYSFDGPKGKMTVRAGDHALIQDMYQAKLVKSGDSYKPEVVKVVPADDVAPAETK